MKKYFLKHREEIIVAVIVFAAIVVSLLFFSCGAKTVNKQESKTDSTSVTIASKKVDSSSFQTKEVKFDTQTDEICIEAVDTSKPIEIVNNEGEVTKYKNARLSHKKKKDNTIVVEEKKVSKIVVDTTANEVEVNKVESTKVIYKEQFNWSKFVLSLWWLWLLILIIAYLGYRYYKGPLKIKLPLF